MAQDDNRRMFPNYKSEVQSHSLWQEKFVDFVHLSCSQASWLPIFIKVYFLGVFECVINTIQKYVLVNDQDNKNNQIKSLIDKARDNQSPNKRLAVITGGDTGIGCELAKALMDSGMDVIISEYILNLYRNMVNFGTKCELSCPYSSGYIGEAITARCAAN
jgi:hypothetical protein